MKSSDTANAIVGFTNLNAFFLQVGIVGIIVWLNTGSLAVGIGVLFGLSMMLAFRRLAWLVIGGFTICWGWIGWTFWGLGGAVVLGFIGLALNWSVSQFVQVCSGGFDGDAELVEGEETEIEVEELKQCPFCAEDIKAEAKVCRYCKSSVLEESIKLE